MEMDSWSMWTLNLVKGTIHKIGQSNSSISMNSSCYLSDIFVTLETKAPSCNYHFSWCAGAESSFYVGDFNGDLRDDWLCHYPDGRICVRYNSMIFGCKLKFHHYLLEEIYCNKELSAVQYFVFFFSSWYVPEDTLRWLEYLPSWRY